MERKKTNLKTKFTKFIATQSKFDKLTYDDRKTEIEDDKYDTKKNINSNVNVKWKNVKWKSESKLVEIIKIESHKKYNIKKSHKNGTTRYEGDRVNGKKEGYGTMHYSSGDRYKGNWKNDKREGDGTYYYSNGDRYEGNWKNGKKEGYGTYYYSNGDRYKGNRKNNKKEGAGIVYYSNGDRYKGNWKNGKKEGYGTYYYSNGDRYKGNWKNGKKEGTRVIYYNNGDKKIIEYVKTDFIKKNEISLSFKKNGIFLEGEKNNNKSYPSMKYIKNKDGIYELYIDKEKYENIKEAFAKQDKEFKEKEEKEYFVKDRFYYNYYNKFKNYYNRFKNMVKIIQKYPLLYVIVRTCQKDDVNPNLYKGLEFETINSNDSSAKITIQNRNISKICDNDKKHSFYIFNENINNNNKNYKKYEFGIKIHKPARKREEKYDGSDSRYWVNSSPNSLIFGSSVKIVKTGDRFISMGDTIASYFGRYDTTLNEIKELLYILENYGEYCLRNGNIEIDNSKGKKLSKEQRIRLIDRLDKLKEVQNKMGIPSESQGISLSK